VNSTPGGRPATPCRVGIFGKVGAGNIGNDASMEAALGYLRSQQPGAVADAMCTGPETVRARYGIAAVPLFWHHKFTRHTEGPVATGLKVIGKGADAIRIARWVRRHEVVIVPGAGVLEASLPMIPRGFPYALFLLSAWGRVFGTKVALVSVGAGAINQPLTRWFFNTAARLASYRSYRDPGAKEAMRARGIDVSRDGVYPDLAFALGPPPAVAVDEQTVAVGVMEYTGTNDERKQAAAICARYVAAMTTFVRQLVDGGRKVLLIVGDVNGSDDAVAQQILADVRSSRPGLSADAVTLAVLERYGDVMAALGPVHSVVAIRYHNVLCGLKMSKPTVGISYSPKHDVLMAEMGLPEFSLAVSTLDVGELTARFAELEKRAPELRQTLAEHNAERARLVQDLFSELTSTVFARAGSSAGGEAATGDRQAPA
jgi:polysaccharide pyruvyl transferase WcaK-like protein